MDDTSMITGWKAIADFFHCHKDTIQSWNKKDPMPVYKINGAYCAFKSDLLIWMEKYKQKNNAEFYSKEK